MVGLSYLLGGLAAACDRRGSIMTERDPANTTRSCHKCGTLNNPGAQRIVTCAGCGAVWDVDRNACANLLRGVQSGDYPLIRSKRQKAGKSGPSAIAQRRALALRNRKK